MVDVEVVYVAEESSGCYRIGEEGGDIIEMGGVDDADAKPSSERTANPIWTQDESTPLRLSWTLS